jgi:N-acetylglucosamine kinase-like BadF-type ATPase
MEGAGSVESQRAAVLAVDGGNSKADLALVGGDGRLLARVVGPTVSHQAVGLEAALAALGRLAADAASRAGLDPSRRPLASYGAFCLAGADSPHDIDQLTAAINRLGLVSRIGVRNDTEAPLRAGTQGWGVAVVSGTGINAIGRSPDGRVARFAGLGLISGDHGGGGAAGMLALGAAAAARERRGPRTSLERSVPAHFGLRRPLDVAFALEHGQLGRSRLRELAPIVFADAAAGDRVARGIVDHLADQVVAFATAAIRRLRLSRTPVPVILSGGVFRAEDGPFHERILAGVTAVAASATVRVLEVPPVLGAGLLGLDALEADADAKRRLCEEFGLLS